MAKEINDIDTSFSVTSSSLSRKEITSLKNNSNNKDGYVTSNNVSWMVAKTLPEVVVISYINDNPRPVYWYFYDGMLGGGSVASGSYTYGASNPHGSGNGHGTSTDIQIDFEHPENAPAIDVKRYLDCFGATQEADDTYTITIATDIPVDGDASTFFNWSENSPGHSYIELYKNGDAGLIQQNIGFYPNTGWKSTTGGNTGSKIVDNAHHEYNARYTISVSASKFQAALNAVQTYSKYDYNIATFNCTDFALDIFNAAGGGLNIPKYQIPGFPNGTAGSSTPQGLYIKLDQMAAAGYTGVEKPGVKGYGDGSHGPCN